MSILAIACGILLFVVCMLSYRLGVLTKPPVSLPLANEASLAKEIEKTTTVVEKVKDDASHTTLVNYLNGASTHISKPDLTNFPQGDSATGSNPHK